MAEPWPSGYSAKLRAPTGDIVAVDIVRTATRNYSGSGGSNMTAAMYEDPALGIQFGFSVNTGSTKRAKCVRLMLAALATMIVAHMVGEGDPPPFIYVWPITYALIIGNDGSARPRGLCSAVRLLTVDQYPTTEVDVPAYGMEPH